MFEDLNNIFYCASRRDKNNLELFEKLTFKEGDSISFANVNLLLNNRETVKALLKHKNIKRIISVIPSHLRTLIALENFNSLLVEESLEEISKNNLVIILNTNYKDISYQDFPDEMQNTSSTQLSFNFY